MKTIFNSESGQTLLIVILIVVVSLTVGLSLASRSIVNLRISTEEDNSQRAFSAAEAGVEEALKTGEEVELSLGNNAVVKANKPTTVGGNEFIVNCGADASLCQNIAPVAKDDGVDVWLVDHMTDGTLNYNSGWQTTAGSAGITVYWGLTSDKCNTDSIINTMAAVEIIVISGRPQSPVSTRYAVDPCSDRRLVNKFSSEDGGVGSVAGKTFAYRKSIYIADSSRGIVVRVVPLYANTQIGIKGTRAFPSQGKSINSTGKSGDTARKITYYQGFPKLPNEFFQYILFSSQQ
ncbi:MAG: hypothetical protein HYV37_04010 [Candidatus Levyibacteriota bacterium]|nr:MAG: hypothetical protein HYV37_04010 [Candidatus Levybacteria bacterium]